MVHYDNTKAHISKKTLTFLDQTCFEKMKHPPFSPDLSSCDFVLFGKSKSRLIGIQCEIENELQNEISKILGEFSQEEITAIFYCGM